MADIPKDWCVNMAKLEDGGEIGAGSPDHPLRWVSCEACGGSGETIRVVPTSTFEAPHEYPEICGACGGTGRDCVEVSPVECNDDQPTN